jgi:formylglycine-generating enzyme required for sulfatase activity
MRMPHGGAAVTMVQQWSGREVRALREARRMSVRDFAAHLGISDRMVSKWEKGGDTIHPRPINQAALDTSLKQADEDVRARFARALGRSEPIESSTAGESRPAIKTVEHSRDGKLMALVEAGEFLSGPENESVFLSAFHIDVYQTTNREYAEFVAATGHQIPNHWVDGTFPGHLSNHPVVFVTWDDANAYAEWARKELPTSQQWEKAARGPHDDTYPWGNSSTTAKCNVRESGIRATTPVDRYHSGASPYGVYDMCGNVWEWCSTITEPNRRELKGSAFTSPFSRAAPATFNDAATDMLDDDTGFRCAIWDQ